MTEPEANASTSLSFEQALAELESIVNGLERGTLSLEDSVNAFERGTKLLTTLSARLDDAEKRVKLLIESDNQLTERLARNAEDA